MLQNVLLELDGKPAGRLFDYSGGSVQAEVVEVATGKTLPIRKHVANVSFSDIVLACGPGMSKSFYDWIGAAFSEKYHRKNGAVTVLHNPLKPSARREFTEGIISSVVLPALDANNKDDAVMTVSISPESIQLKKSAEAPSVGIYATSTAKVWHPSNFRLQIDGLESDCRHVTKIDSIAIGIKAAIDEIGATREAQRIPGRVEFPNITIYIPEMYADGFVKWMDEFVIKGNARSGGEKNGSLKFLTASDKEYFELTLEGLGIFSLSVTGSQVKTNQPVKIGMYCQRMSFKAGATSIT